MQETIIAVTDFIAGTISVWGKMVAVFFLLGIIPVWALCHKKLSKIAEGTIEEITEAVKNQGQNLSPGKFIFKDYRQEFIDGIVDGVKKPAIQAVNPILKLVIVAFAKSMVFLAFGILFVILARNAI